MSRTAYRQMDRNAVFELPSEKPGDPLFTDTKHVLDLYDDHGYWRRKHQEQAEHNHGEAVAVPVFVSISISRVDEVQCASSSFKLRMAIFLQIEIDLKEKKLGHLVDDAAKKCSGTLVLSPAQEQELLKAGVRVPELNFMNTTEFLPLEAPSFRVYARPTESGLDCLHWNNTFAATFRQLYNLHSFPFDHQKLVMELQLADPHQWDQFHLTVHAVQFRRSAVLDLEEWAMHKPRIEKRQPANRRVDIELRLSRKSGYYMWNVVFVMSLLSLLGFTAFTDDYRNTGGRVSLVLTLMLTCVAYKFSLVDVLPRLSYFTLLDSYMLQTLALLFIVALSSCGAAVWEVHAETFFPQLAHIEPGQVDTLFGFLSFLVLVFLEVLLFARMAWNSYGTFQDRLSADDFERDNEQQQWLCHHFAQPFFFPRLGDKS